MNNYIKLYVKYFIGLLAALVVIGVIGHFNKDTGSLYLFLLMIFLPLYSIIFGAHLAYRLKSSSLKVILSVLISCAMNFALILILIQLVTLVYPAYPSASFQ